MQVRIRVWGHYDQHSRTPLISDTTWSVDSYGEGNELVRKQVAKCNGKSGNGQFDGPNQNFNSYWYSR